LPASGGIYYNSGNVGIGTTIPSYALSLGNAGSDVQHTVALYENPGGANLFGFEFPFSGVNRVAVVVNGSERMSVLINGNVGIGTTNPGSYKLAVEGTIGARDVIVTNAPWSDYVFRPGYRLRPLSEVASYVQEHHHLPDIPSESEVKEKGVSLGEMQSKLLAKVEELTLHVIHEHERNDRLEQRNRELEKRLASLEARQAQ
jgi:hypothetical protein